MTIASPDAAGQPRTPPPLLDTRPEPLPWNDLSPYRHFVGWRLEWRPGMNRKPGAWTKVPINPFTGARARSDDPATWGGVGDVLDRFARIGFVMADDDPFSFIDVDQGWDLTAQRPKPWAHALIAAFSSYWERSPSGTGLKGLVRGRPPRNRIVRLGDGQVEIFFTGKFTTLTGHHLAGTPASIVDCQAALDAFFARHAEPPPPAAQPRPAASALLSDDEVIARARAARNGGKFARLFDHGDTSTYDHDQSRADQALLSLLTFWTQDPDQIDRLFRASGLSRGKWIDRPDYRRRSMDRALSRGAVYAPQPRTSIAGLRVRNASLRTREVRYA